MCREVVNWGSECFADVTHPTLLLLCWPMEGREGEGGSEGGRERGRKGGKEEEKEGKRSKDEEREEKRDERGEERRERGREGMERREGKEKHPFDITQ